ncbi:hypothetical protein BJ138DRAFT_1105663 [Hygrophoropsis aurantiaca]|uniref:Uncharacterized protein n=1 Tax=Hygrophoropsis aurantiaca TaxID=72124 RepID=A0ACB7ZYQ6_9AGAM|nr:hypothetical protein BJ138DRAFT_1105663 [Hygrophoropsis aurantiaca]
MVSSFKSAGKIRRLIYEFDTATLFAHSDLRTATAEDLFVGLVLMQSLRPSSDLADNANGRFTLVRASPQVFKKTTRASCHPSVHKADVRSARGTCVSFPGSNSQRSTVAPRSGLDPLSKPDLGETKIRVGIIFYDGVGRVDFVPYNHDKGYSITRSPYYEDGGKTVHEMLKAEGEDIFPLQGWPRLALPQITLKTGFES